CVTALAALAYREGRWDDAAALFAKADEIDPSNADVHHGWGLALAKLERWADADAHFRRALTIDPRHAGASEAASEARRHVAEPPAKETGRGFWFASLLILGVVVLLGACWWLARRRR